MFVSDPLQTLWDALESQGWDPEGPVHKFRANCPCHGGDSHQLRVAEGADGRAVMFCHTRRCDTRDILSALGLRMADLFPPGHRNARPRPVPVAAPPVPKTATERLTDLLSLIDETGARWTASVETKCQFCGSPEAWIRCSSGTEPYVDCPDGCGPTAFMQLLTANVTEARATKEVSSDRP